jgi:3-deoxy-7-phosphoheptulonate synthase
MGHKIEKVIPRPSLVLDKLPLSESLKKRVDNDRKEIINIIEGKDSRKILIIGPCCAWPDKAVIEYAKKLKPLADKVKNKIKIIMRVYTQKPRTSVGWTGAMNQPDPFGEPDLEHGIFYCREMMLDILEIGLPIADEALFTHNEGYFNDLISWIAIGARSAEDQEHRVFASMIDHPVGMKNPTSGHIPTGVNSVLSAQHTHVFLLNRKQVRTTGNPHAHLILRGGKRKPNCTPEKLKEAADLLEKKTKNPSILVDVSHDNCIDPETGEKDPMRQPIVLFKVVESMKKDKMLMKTIKGFMVESFMKSGCQKIESFLKLDTEGLSIMDPCIGWDETEMLIKEFYKSL